MIYRLYDFVQPIAVSTFGFLAETSQRVPWLAKRTEKLSKTWEIRKVDGKPAFTTIDPAVFGGKTPVWIHAASGEFEYAKPVVRDLAALGIPVFVTYFSPTYMENVRKFPGVTASCALPLEDLDEIESMIDLVQPRALLVARTDTWPNMMRGARAKKIPSLLFSTTFHEESRRMGPLAKSLTKAALLQLDQIQCVSEEDRDTLKTLGLNNVEIAGDSRYDQVIRRIESPKPLPTTLTAALRKNVFVAGSVWKEDLEPVMSGSFLAQKAFPHTLILVPHETEEDFLEEIESRVEKELKVKRASRLTDKDRDLDVVILDSVGILAELYTRANLAFVGGSFRKTVHSVMEPLAAGCLTLVGPLHRNNREAIEFQSLVLPSTDITMVSSAADTSEFQILTRRALEYLKTQGEAETKKLIQQEVKERGGATALVLNWLKNQSLLS